MVGDIGGIIYRRGFRPSVQYGLFWPLIVVMRLSYKSLTVKQPGPNLIDCWLERFQNICPSIQKLFSNKYLQLAVMILSEIFTQTRLFFQLFWCPKASFGLPARGQLHSLDIIHSVAVVFDLRWPETLL